MLTDGQTGMAKREERKPTRCNNIDDLLSMVDVDYWHCLNMFRASVCPSSGERPRVTACGVYFLVVLDVAGCGTVVLRWGCDHCEGCCSTQPSQWSHPQRSTTVPQTATSSTTRKYTPHAVTSVFLLKMGIKMPETCWDSVNNQHPLLTINHLYCCILLVFFPHALFTMHGHRNIKVWQS